MLINKTINLDDIQIFQYVNLKKKTVFTIPINKTTWFISGCFGQFDVTLVYYSNMTKFLFIKYGYGECKGI